MLRVLRQHLVIYEDNKQRRKKIMRGGREAGWEGERKERGEEGRKVEGRVEGGKERGRCEGMRKGGRERGRKGRES